jgi:hypothetical protein
MAIAMPVFGRLFDRDEYGTAYALAAVSPTIGYFLWLAARSFDRRTRLATMG